MIKVIITSLVLLFPAYSWSQESVYTWYFAGNKELFKKNYNEAIKNYNKAIEIDPKADFAYFNRANAKFELKDYQAARLDYNQTILLNDQYAEAYCGRGKCKYYLGDKEGACEDLKKSKKLDFKEAGEVIKEMCK